MDIHRLAEFTTDLATTKSKIRDAGLAVSALSSGARMFAAGPTDRAEHVDTVARYAALCESLSARYVRVFGGRLDGTPLDRAIDVSLEQLEKMSVVGRGVEIAVETHDDWAHTASLAKLFERVTAANVCVLWDLHHPYRLAGESPRETYDNIGRYVRYTHLKDSMPTDDGKIVPALPGDGDVPLNEMVDLLIAGGYEGYLALEWEKHWRPEIAAPDVALARYAGLLRKLAAGA